MPVRYLYEGRIGKANALNTAIANVAADILAFTDDDVRIGPEWLILLVEAIRNSGCIGAGGPVVPVWQGRKPRWVSDTEPCRMQAAIVEFHHDGGTTMREAAPLGANAALRREAFQRYGTYRTDLGHVGRTPLPAEDTEFIRRLYAAGEALCYAPAAIVHHPVDPRRLTRRYFLDWYIARGRVEMLEHVGEAGPRLLGVPHHVIRRAAESMVRWLVSLRPSVRFYHKLMVYRWIGAMQQSFAVQRPDVDAESDRRR